MEDTGTVEQTPEQVRADMEAGFNETTTDVAPTETPAPTEAAPVETTPEPVPEPEAVVEDPHSKELEAVRNELREAEARFAKQLRDVHGKFGEVNSRVEQAVKAISTTSASGAVKLNQKALAKAREDFGDDYADSLISLFELTNAPEPVASPAQQPGIDPGEVEIRIAEARAEAEAKAKAESKKDLAIAVIDIKHPDRLEIQKTPAWGQWLKQLPEVDRNVVMTTWDHGELSKRLDSFKAWNTRRLANAKRLAGAVTPRGQAPASPAATSFENDLRSGWESVFKT